MENHHEEKEVRLEREDSAGSSSSACSSYGYPATEGFPILDVLEIMKESMRLLRKRSAVFMSVAATLIVPIAFIVLSHILVTHSLIKRLAVQIEAVCLRGTLAKAPINTFLYLKLSELVLSSVVFFPFCIIFSLPAKASISYTVVSAYAGRKLSLTSAVGVVPRHWKRLVITYLWVCIVDLGALAGFITLLAATASVIKFFKLDPGLLVFTDLVLAIVFCLIFAWILVVCNLAIVASVMEDLRGFAALSRGLMLIKGRTQVALGLLAVTNVCGVFIEVLFQSHILGSPDEPFQDMLSILWEAPLLISMYSVVYMFDGIMATIFYFTCKAFRFECFEKYAHLGVSHVSRRKTLPL